MFIIWLLKQKMENLMFFAGDCNAQCQNWYANGDTNEKGLIIDDLTSSLDLNQLISEPTYLEENRNPHLY